MVNRNLLYPRYIIIIIIITCCVDKHVTGVLYNIKVVNILKCYCVFSKPILSVCSDFTSYIIQINYLCSIHYLYVNNLHLVYIMFIIIFRYYQVNLFQVKLIDGRSALYNMYIVYTI